jgi:anti-anti-sigma factor
MSERLELRLRNDLAELERIGRQLDEFGRAAGFPAADRSAIGLAVDELFTNIVSYAFPPGESHFVTLRAGLRGDLLTVELEDDGRPFDPTTAPAPSLNGTLEDRPVGGLGIHFARRLVDSMSYRRQDGRNLLRLTKRLTTVESSPAPSTHTATALVHIGESEAAGTVIFRLVGQLDSGAAARLEKRLRARLARGALRFVFDCEALAYLSSAGLRVLLIAAKAAAARRGGVALTSARADIAQTIEMAGLSQALPNFADRAQALAALSAVPGERT